MIEHNAKEIGLRTRRQRGAFDYNRGRLVELSEISNSFPSDIEHGDRGFSVALLGRLSRVPGLSADCILFGTEQAADISDIIGMFSGLDGKCIPKPKGLLGAYLKTITFAKKQSR